MNKLLFFADFFAHLTLGSPMTGQEYQCLQKGPAPRYLLPIIEEMRGEGAIAQRVDDYYGYRQCRTLALREPVLEDFTPQEIDLINRVVGACWGKNASAVSDLSHRFMGWKCADIQETIPYSVALIGRRAPTQAEIEYGRELEPLAAQCLGA